MKMKNRGALVALALPALLLTACGQDSSGDDTTGATGPSTGTASTAEVLSIENGYCKAKAEAPADAVHNSMETMTACFGELVNESDEDVNIASFTVTNLPAETHYELHETVDGIMREKDGGFDIAAGAYKSLEPGGDHLMIMEHNAELPAGMDLDIVLTLRDGTTVDFTLPVREQAAGDEDYSNLG